MRRSRVSTYGVVMMTSASTSSWSNLEFSPSLSEVVTRVWPWSSSHLRMPSSFSVVPRRAGTCSGLLVRKMMIRIYQMPLCHYHYFSISHWRASPPHVDSRWPAAGPPAFPQDERSFGFRTGAQTAPSFVVWIETMRPPQIWSENQHRQEAHGPMAQEK